MNKTQEYSDAPTTSVTDEETVEFVRGFNDTHTDTRFDERNVTFDSPIRNRSSIDPANPPRLRTHSMIAVIDAYEQAVEDGNLPAAAALRRQDSIRVQNRLAGLLEKYRDEL